MEPTRRSPYTGERWEIREEALGSEHGSVARTLYGSPSCTMRAGTLRMLNPFTFDRSRSREKGVWTTALRRRHRGHWIGAALLRPRVLPPGSGLVPAGPGDSGASFGTGHPRIASTANQLALLLQAQGQAEEAESLYRRALTIEEKALGQENPEVAARSSSSPS